jgi:hypothetical protein
MHRVLYGPTVASVSWTWPIILIVLCYMVQLWQVSAGIVSQYVVYYMVQLWQVSAGLSPQYTDYYMVQLWRVSAGLGPQCTQYYAGDENGNNKHLFQSFVCPSVEKNNFIFPSVLQREKKLF